MDRIWHKMYGTEIPTEIEEGRYGSLLQLFDEAVEQYADLTAFVGLGGALTYRDVDQLSKQFAAYLQTELGISKGDRIALLSPNILAFPVAMFGIIRAGAVQVNVNPLYTAHELRHQLKDADVSAAVVFAGATKTLVEAMKSVTIPSVVVIDAGDLGQETVPSIAISPDLQRFTRFTDAISLGADRKPSPVDLTQSDLIFLQYTGGTTGLAKGAALTHGNLVSNILQFKAFTPGLLERGGNIVVSALPLYHIFALMVNCLSFFSAGAKNILIANARDLDGLVAVLEQHPFTVITGVNTLFAGLLSHPRFRQLDFTSLRVTLGGGSPILTETSDKWRLLTGKHIKEGFGMSETSPIVTLNPLRLDTFTGTVGIPLPSTDVSLRDELGVEVAIGVAGELCVKGPQVMRGYWRREHDSANVFWPDGYLRTGDIAVADSSGFIRIVDRLKDMILVSGFNVYPNEVEAVVASCSGVRESACIGVPDRRTGEAVHLFVVAEPEVSLSEEQVREHCRERLAAYKQPRYVKFVPELPKSTVGKTLRIVLRGQANATS